MKRALAFLLTFVGFSAFGIGTFSGSWEAEVQLLPATDLGLTKNVLTVNYSDFGWTFGGKLSLLGKTADTLQVILSGALGPATLKGNMYFDFAPAYKKSDLTLEMDFAGLSLSMKVEHFTKGMLDPWPCRTVKTFPITGTMTGPITGTISGVIAGDLEGSYSGSLDGQLQGSIAGTVSGDLTGYLDGSLSGDFDGYLDGIFYGLILGAEVEGEIEADVVATLVGFFDGYINGQTTSGQIAGVVNGSIDGYFDGYIEEGTISGFVGGNVSGEVDGDITGDVSGTFEGELTGTYEGSITADFEGEFEANFEGEIEGELEGEINASVTGTGTLTEESDYYMRYTLSLGVDPMSLTLVFDDCCTGIAFKSLTFGIKDVSLCCGISYDVEFSFLKSGFNYLKITGIEIPLCCGVSLTAGVTFTTEGKEVETGFSFAGIGDACFTVYADVLGKPPAWQGLVIYGWKIKCALGDCSYLQIVTALDPGWYNKNVENVFVDDEFEYVKLGFCGAGCCGGTWTVDISVFFQDTGSLFGITRIGANMTIPVMTNLSFTVKFATPDTLKVGWKFTF